MMRSILIFLIFVGTVVLYINQRKREQIEQQKIEEVKKKEVIKNIDPFLPDEYKSEYSLSFSKDTIKTLRRLTTDTNENIRFSAIELLWQLKDKSISEIIKRSFDTETETSIKLKIIDMLSKEKSRLSLRLIGYALNNYDKETRLKACEALGGFVDKETIDILTPALKDYDDDVRLKALESIDKVKKAIESHRESKVKEILEPRPVFKVE